jgi:hypothetical protein
VQHSRRFLEVKAISRKMHSLKLVIIYLLGLMSTLVALLFSFWGGLLPFWVETHKQFFFCALAGGIGGGVYCLRGVYLNACVRKDWDPSWLPWYYIRPFVSLVCGGISCLFLKAGLLVLESSPKQGSTDLGFIALAFIAGFNVDKFISKIEDISQATWGIEKSKASKLKSPSSEPDQP